jgi:DNA (cytosine-5)-methyltransferase 1
LFLLNAAAMGVPQKRERTVFIANRLNKKIVLNFNEPFISVRDAFVGLHNQVGKITEHQAKWWKLCKPGKSFSSIHPNGSWFNSAKAHPDLPANTLTASGGAGAIYHYSECRQLSNMECIRVQTFPDDYNLMTLEAKYICGMSVPPFMMQRIANQIAIQFFERS